MNRWPAMLLMTLWLPLVAGCSWFAKAPMDVLTYDVDAGTPQKNLFVFMRGIGGSHRKPH